MSLLDLFLRKTFTDNKGYVRFSDSGRPVHRSVAQKMLGRKLRKGEVVHHKDRNKRNNSWKNLHVFPSQLHHDRVHRYDAKRYGKDYSYAGKRKSTFWIDWW